MVTVTSEWFYIVGTVSKKGYKPDKLPLCHKTIDVTSWNDVNAANE